jgi:hypothetical protein
MRIYAKKFLSEGFSQTVRDAPVKLDPFSGRTFQSTTTFTTKC